MRILLTGGAGYIGSHTAVALAAAGHKVFCFDNLSNSRAGVMDQLETITGQSMPLIVGDIRDRNALEQAMRCHAIEAVIHFAGLKAVGEAVAKPLIYYDNNVRGTLSLIEAMIACSVKTLVFSSSATVYGEPQYLPLNETHPTSATNPYGRTKLMIEEMLTDIAAADQFGWPVASAESWPMFVRVSGDEGMVNPNLEDISLGIVMARVILEFWKSPSEARARGTGAVKMSVPLADQLVDVTVQIFKI